MKYNRTRHRVLGFLAKKFNEDLSSKRADDSGLNFSEIDNLLRKKKNQRTLIVSELFKEKEIEYFRLNQVEGYMINPTLGLSAYSEKKYLKRNHEIIINWLKNLVQIIIPIATVAILALGLRIKNTDKAINKKFDVMNQKIINLEEKVNQLEILKNDTIINVL